MHLHKMFKRVQLRQKTCNFPFFCLGDTIRVGVLIEEGNKQRTQIYQGTLISKCKTNTSTTIVVRRIFRGVGIERVFFLYSLLIQYTEVLRCAKVRRVKLYYLRYLKGKAIRLKERFLKF